MLVTQYESHGSTYYSEADPYKQFPIQYRKWNYFSTYKDDKQIETIPEWREVLQFDRLQLEHFLDQIVDDENGENEFGSHQCVFHWSDVSQQFDSSVFRSGHDASGRREFELHSEKYHVILIYVCVHLTHTLKANTYMTQKLKINNNILMPKILLLFCYKSDSYRRDKLIDISECLKFKICT